MNKKNLLKLYSGLVAICLVFLAVIPFFSEAPIKNVEAAGLTYDVSGYAWSWHPHEQGYGDKTMTAGSVMLGGNTTSLNLYGEPNTGTQGFGWISMNGTNPNAGGGSYKVTLDPATGKFSGYAWSENGGWVNFAPSGPYPSAAGTTAQSAYVDPVCLADKTQKCSVKGWIRFVEGASGNSSWDGWVNMEIFNDAAAAAPYNFDYSIPLGARASGVKILPESGGYRPMDGYAWGDDLVGIVGFGKTKIKIEQIDVCPDTKFNLITEHPMNGYVNGTYIPKTVGMQIVLPNPFQVINGMCGIFGCTDVTAANYRKEATNDDGSCIPREICPDGSVPPNGDLSQCPQPPTCTPKSDNYNPVFKDCRECNPKVSTYNETTGLCTVDPGGNGDPEDQCKNVEGFQGTVVAPYTQVIQAGVKNCYVIGCTDPYANNYNKDATMSANPDICTYDNPGETCKQKGNCPNLPTAPKKPIYIET